jgi:head-tail adaptor
MSIDGFYTLDVTVLRAGAGTPKYGNATLDWTDPSMTMTSGWLAQHTSAEPVTTGRTTAVITDSVLFLPPETDITERDRVEVDGRTYAIDGVPVKARTPRGVHHLEVKLRAVEG